WIMRQSNIPNNFIDYLPPPPAYQLWRLEFATMFQFNKHFVHLGVSVNNLFNITYRDYMNRFRYFNDEMGRNIGIRMKLNIN
ncbi:MAG: hypothetical protein ACOVNR_05205, partial [Chitinophagaceae bacterium]